MTHHFYANTMTIIEAAHTIHAYALTFPGAYEDHPWEETVIKVDKKIFVFLGAENEDITELFMTVKLPTAQEEALRFSFCSPSGYNLGKTGWITVRFPAEAGDPPVDLFLTWIEESYRAVAPKKRVEEYDASKH